MKVSQKLTIGFSSVLLVAIIVGMIGIVGMRALRHSASFMYENRVRGIEYVHAAQNHFNEIRVQGRNMLINSFYDDKKGAADSYAQVELHIEGFLSNLEKSREAIHTVSKSHGYDELLAFYDRIYDIFKNKFLPAFREHCEMCINDIPDHHNKLYLNIQIASLSKISRQIEQLLLGLLELNSTLARQASIDNTHLTWQYAIWLFTLLLVAITGVIIISYRIIKGIATPINESASVLKEIADGNFEARVTGSYNDEFQIIKKSINFTAQQLAIYLAEKRNHIQQILIDTIPHPVFYKDSETRYFGFNKAYAEVFGVDTQAILGKTVLELDYLPMEDRLAYQAEDEKIVAESGHISYEMPMTFHDGKMHETLYSVTGFKNPDGTPGGLLGIFIDITDLRETQRALNSSMEKVSAQNKIILDSITYASKIQRNLLPHTSVIAPLFDDYAVIWEPRDIVGGDIYWMKHFPFSSISHSHSQMGSGGDIAGTVLCIADCTGHGVPGALLTTLVVSAMQVIATHYNCHDTADMMYKLDQRLAIALNAQKDTTVDMTINDGCDIAVVFVAADGSVTFSASGINVFVCDGQKVIRHKGQSYYIGEGKIQSKDDIKMVTIPADTPPLPPLTEGGKKFYIASDGLFDQMNTDKKKWGFKEFQEIILENHSQQLDVISKKVWQAFTTYQADEIRCDDVQLICFVPKEGIREKEKVI